MVAARSLETNPFSTAEDLRKHVIRLLQNNGEETRGNVLVLPQVFLDFLDYDHKAALFLNKLLYWSERTKHPQRWIYKTYHEWYQELGFKESVVRRLLYGDPRAQTHKRTLTDIGVEVAVRRAPNGSPTCHYRLNLEVFLDAIRAFLDQQGYAADPVQCTVSNPCNAQAGKLAMQVLEGTQCGETLDQVNTAQISSEETSSESCDLDDDLLIFMPYRKRFGKFKAELHDLFRQQISRLGSDRVGEVLERCASRGRSWSYVLRALENEAETPSNASSNACWDSALMFCGAEGQMLSDQPESAALPVSERLQTPLKKGTALQIWNAVFDQMNAQLGSDFRNRAHGVTLVDFEANSFIVAAKTPFIRDELEGRLARAVQRILSDVGGQGMAVQVLLEDEWVERYSGASIALSA